MKRKGTESELPPSKKTGKAAYVKVPVQVYNCTKCNFTNSHLTGFKTHMLSHTGKIKTCKYCGFQSDIKGYFNRVWFMLQKRNKSIFCNNLFTGTDYYLISFFFVAAVFFSQNIIYNTRVIHVFMPAKKQKQLTNLKYTNVPSVTTLTKRQVRSKNW